MQTYAVTRRCTCEHTVYVIAGSASEAKKKAAAGDIDDMSEIEPLNDWRLTRDPAVPVED